MKKGLTFAALSALSLTAVVAPTPQAHAAEAEVPGNGFYNIKTGEYKKVEAIKDFSNAEKLAWFVNEDVYVVVGNLVISMENLISIEDDEELLATASTVEEFNADKKVDLLSIYEKGKAAEATVASVSAINKTTVKVELSQAVDAVSASNFTIEGGSVTAATLSEDKKTVTLAVSGLAYDGTYTVVAKDIKVNGEAKDFGSKEFKVPAVTEFWTLKVSSSAQSVVANGADNAVITFELLNAQGQVDQNADNMVLAIDSTFGNLANSRVTVQNGVGQVIVASEFSTKEVISKISAQIIEASGDYKDLIGKVAGEASLKFLPSGAETDPSAVTFLDAESNQADRVVLYFDKAVAPSTFVETTKAGKYKSVDGIKQVTKDNVTIQITQEGDAEDTSREIVGFRSVEGNDKAIEVILAKDDALTDNASVTVVAELGTTKNEKSFVLTDARQPEVTSVTPEGLKTLKLKFSESVLEGTFKIDGLWSEGKEFEVEYGEFDAVNGIDYRDTATLTLLTYTDGTAGYDVDKNKDKQRYFEPGSHSLAVTNLKDFAGKTDRANVSTSQGLTFTIAENKEAPTATVSVESPEQFRVKFDKEVEYSAADLAKLFGDSFEIYDADQKKYVPVAEVKDVFKANVLPEFTVEEYDNEFVVELTEDWTKLLDKSEDAYYNYKFQFNLTAGAFTNASNGVESAAIVLDLNQNGSPLNTADNKSPEILAIDETTNDEVFKVTMNEAVKLTEADGTSVDNNDTASVSQNDKLPTVQVEFQGKDKDGKNVVIAGTVLNYTAGQKGADKAFDVSTPDGATLQDLVNQGHSENWKVVVRSISDDIGNTAATLTKDFVVERETEENEFEIIAKQNGYDEHKVVAYDTNTVGQQDKIEITFTKGVVNTGGINDLTSPANWTLNGAKLADVATIEVADTNNDPKDGYEKVIITFNDEKALRSGSNTIAVNKSILSKDGTVLTGVNEVVAITIDVDKVAAAEAVVAAAQAVATQAATDLAAAQAVATQAATDLAAAQAVATQAATDLAAAQAVATQAATDLAADPTNPTLIAAAATADAAVTAAQTAKDNADVAVTAAQTAKDNADAAVTAAQTAKDNADADLAAAKAALAAL